MIYFLYIVPSQYIDYRLGFGPIILGHGYGPVVERVAAAIRNGTVFAWTIPLEIQVAERFCRMTGMDKVRLANSGTEATMHALRIARAYTGRERFIKFEGQYHGMYDYVLFSTAGAPVSMLGSRRNPINVQSSSGIPEGIRQYVINISFLHNLSHVKSGRYMISLKDSDNTELPVGDSYLNSLREKIS